MRVYTPQSKIFLSQKLQREEINLAELQIKVSELEYINTRQLSTIRQQEERIQYLEVQLTRNTRKYS